VSVEQVIDHYRDNELRSPPPPAPCRWGE